MIPKGRRGHTKGGGQFLQRLYRIRLRIRKAETCMGASLGRIDSRLFKSRSIGRRWGHNGEGVQFLHSKINEK